MRNISAQSVSFRSVSKTYGDVAALGHVDLEIRPGEFVALLGPSGSGKTTLLNIAAGFIQPTTGQVFIGDHDVTQLPPRRRNIGMMFQSYALFPHLSVFENIAFGLRVRKRPEDEIRSRVMRALTMVQMEGTERRRIGELSGGQQQRVALARAVAIDPNLLLMDEPLGALDRQLRKHMQLEIRRLHREIGGTTIYVTHDQEEALVMADRMAVLKDGRLLQCATPHEVYERPADAFVAGFIGVMNFCTGSVVAEGVRARDGSVVAGALPQGMAPGEAAIAAVRPERVALFPPADIANRASGAVEALAYHGLDLQLHVRTALAERPFLVRVTADNADRRKLAVGDTVEFGWSAADTRIFRT